MKFGSTFLLLLIVLLVGGGIWYLERETEGTEEREARARQALDIEPEKVRYLRIETTNLVATCRLAGSQWLIESPLKTHAARGEIRRILTGLKNLPKGDVITLEQRRENSLRLHDYGLDAPRARITVRQEGEEREILVGNQATVGDSLYIMEAARDDIVATSLDLLDLLPPDLETLRSRRLLPDAPYVLHRLEIRRPAGFLLLANDAVRGWALQQPVESRAHNAFVQDLIVKLSTAEISRFVEDDVKEFAAYGLDDESAVHVSMLPVGGGSTRALHLGSPDPADPELVFARVDDGSSVFAVSKQLSIDLMLDAEVFRDRRLLNVVETRLVYVKVTEGDATLELLKDDAGSWSLARPRKRAADSARVWSMISGWVDSRVLDFVSDQVTNRADFGLSDPDQTLLLSVYPPEPDVEAGEEPETVQPSPEGISQVTLHLFQDPGDPGRLFAQQADRDNLVTTRAEAFPPVLDRLLWLYDRTVLRLVPSDIRKLELEDAERRQIVHIDPSGAILLGPDQNGDIAQSAVESLLAQVTGLEALRFVVDGPEDLEPFGLAEPFATLTIGLTGDAGISKTLMFGAEAGPDGRFGMIRGQSAVFVLSPEACEQLLQDLVVEPQSASEESREPPSETP